MRILGPLNLLEVDPLLNHLPERAHIPEPLDVPLKKVEDEIDLLLGGELPDQQPGTLP